MAPAYNFNSKFGLDTVATVTKQLDHKGENFGLTEELRDLSGLRGTRSHGVERLRLGRKVVSGTINMQPTALEWSYLLPWILGGTPAGTSYPLAELLPVRYVVIDRIMKVFTYDNVLVSRATLRGASGQTMDLQLDLCGVDETLGNAGTFPVLALDGTTSPFIFEDLVLTLAAVTYQCKDIEIVIDNLVDTDRFFNSVTRSTGANAKDRIITVSTTLPYGDASAVYNTGSTGIAAVATFTYAATSLQATFPRLAFSRNSPHGNDRDEIMLPIVQGKAMSTAALNEAAFVLDSTP